MTRMKWAVLASALMIILAATQLMRPLPAFSQGGCPNLLLVDTKYVPAQQVAPNQEFTVTWTVQNNGTCRWNSNHQIGFIRGEHMGDLSSFTAPVVEPGKNTEIVLSRKAPPGFRNYDATWKMFTLSPYGNYGDDLLIHVQVVAPAIAQTAQASQTAATEPTQTKESATANPEISLTTTTVAQTAAPSPPTEIPSVVPTVPIAPTAVPNPTVVPPTAMPPTAAPPTGVPPTAEPEITLQVPTDGPTLIPTETPQTPTVAPDSNDLVATVTRFVDDGSTPNPPRRILFLAICILLPLLLLLLAFIVPTLIRRGKEASPKKKDLETKKDLPKPIVHSTSHLTGAAIPNRFELVNPTIIGTSDGANLIVPTAIAGAASISPEHARIEKRGARWLIRDGDAEGRQSKTGIFVNDKRTRVNYLQDNDKIRLGDVEFIFHEPPQGAKP